MKRTLPKPAKAIGVTAAGLLSLLLNPLFVTAAVGVAALLVQRGDGRQPPR